MASLHKQKGKPFWFCAFTDQQGKRRFKSTGTPDKAQAETICKSWQSAVKRAKAGKLTPEKAREVIAGTMAEIVALSGETLSSSTVESFCQSWLQEKQNEAGEKTFIRYQGIIKQFLEFLGNKKHRDLSLLSSNDIQGFKAHLLKVKSRGTVNLSLKVLRGALNHGVNLGLLEVNQAKRVKSVAKSGSKRARRPFTLPEIKRLLEVADGEWKGMILFGLYTGQRLGDIAQLTWNNINLERREIVLVTEKTDRRMIIPMAKRLAEYCESIPAADNPDQALFPNSCALTQRHGYTSILSNQFYQIMVSAGLAKERTHESRGKGRDAKRQISEISFHCLRHTATSLLKNAGVPELVARELIGHDSHIVSRSYTHVDMQTLRKAANKMPDVLDK